MRILLLLLISSQLLWAARLGVEIKGGVAVSSFSGKELNSMSYENKTPHVSGAVSIALPIVLSPLLTLQPEISYLQRGATLKSSIQQEIKRDYLDIPLLVRFNFNQDSPFNPFLYIGPTLSILLSAEQTSLTGESLPHSPDHYITPLDFAVTLGGGISIDAGVGAVIIDYRYTRGVISTFDNELWNKDNTTDAAENLDIYNVAMLFMVGYAIDF